MLDDPLHEEILLNIQSEPSLVQLKTVSSHPITCHLFSRLLDFQTLCWQVCQMARNLKYAFLSVPEEGLKAFYPPCT